MSWLSGPATRPMASSEYGLGPAQNRMGTGTMNLVYMAKNHGPGLGYEVCPDGGLVGVLGVFVLTRTHQGPGNSSSSLIFGQSMLLFTFSMFPPMTPADPKLSLLPFDLKESKRHVMYASRFLGSIIACCEYQGPEYPARPRSLDHP